MARVSYKRPSRRCSLTAVALLCGLALGLATFLLNSAGLGSGRSKAEARQQELEAALVTMSQKLMASETERAKLHKELEASAACSDRHKVLVPSEAADAADPEFAAFLRKVAVNNEVLMAVSNKNLAWPGGMLEAWVRNVRAAGVPNAMVVALDDETKEGLDKVGFPSFRMNLEIPDAQKEAGANHAVSALKFRILSRFLKLGYSVFLSDVDVLVLQNPFDFLVRDSDVEGMSDGWDNGTAYGYNDVLDDLTMGWGRYAHSMRVFVINSGTFFIRPTPAAMALLELVAHRLETEGGWDQAVFNECIFFPNRPGYKDPGVTRRVLDYLAFVNSKTLFKRIRHDPALSALRPVLIHLNSHPEKFERLQAAEARYVKGDLHALDPFPDGSGMPSQ